MHAVGGQVVFDTVVPIFIMSALACAGVQGEPNNDVQEKDSPFAHAAVAGRQ
jgi:hypothetical protein